MYTGWIQFTIIEESKESTSLTAYEFSITDTTFDFVKKNICACVKLLELIGAKDINCDFSYDPRKR